MLSYLLANAAEMLVKEGLVMKVETLCTLLCIDCRNNYRSDSSVKTIANGHAFLHDRTDIQCGHHRARARIACARRACAARGRDGRGHARHVL